MRRDDQKIFAALTLVGAQVFERLQLLRLALRDVVQQHVAAQDVSTRRPDQQESLPPRVVEHALILQHLAVKRDGDRAEAQFDRLVNQRRCRIASARPPGLRPSACANQP